MLGQPMWRVLVAVCSFVAVAITPSSTIACVMMVPRSMLVAMTAMSAVLLPPLLPL